MVSYIEVAAISFVTAFIFSLGGLGSAVALIPILTFLGVPFQIARPTGLFTNTVSTVSATIHNLRKGIVDFSFVLPIIITSVFLAPIGAYLSHLVPEKIVALIFVLFLFFAGFMVYIPKKKLFNGTDLKFYPLLVGAISGLLSGLLGVGGGGLISPMLIIAGFDPKKVVVTTAFVVPFSSFAGFLAYWKLGTVDWGITLAAAVPAVVAGYLGAFVTHRFLEPGHVKRILGFLFFILGLKFLMKIL